MPDLDGPATRKALQQFDPGVRCCFMSGEYGLSESYQQGRLAFVADALDVEDVAAVLWSLLTEPDVTV